ncbi:MAG TPA: hypothetical protein VH371_11905 [Candidatus Limnocylindrales bacterium]
MIAVSLRLRVFLGAVLSLAILGCGPSANAIHPTLPPPAQRPGGTNQPQESPPGAEATQVAGAPGTPQPAGIATPMASFPQGSAYEVTGVAVTPSGYMAIGFAGTDQGYFGLHQGITWTSSDGSTWQQQVDPAFLDVSPSYVVAVGSDVYMFGQFETCSDILDDECTQDPNAGLVIFKSTNGGAWQQLAQPSSILQAEFDGVTAWGTTLVAWGAAADDNGTTTVWTSSDGLTWTPSTGIGQLDPVDSMGAGGPGLVAFGSQFVDSIEDTQLVAASSTDGIHYSNATAPSVTGALVASVSSGPGGVVGVGYAEGDTSPSVALTMFSSDGTSWAQTSAADGSFENALMNEVHSNDSAYVAVGSTTDQDDMTYQTGRLWLSADGNSWRSLGDFGGSFNQYGASALGPGGLVIFTEDEEDANDEGTDVKSTINGWLIPPDQLVP